LPFVGQPAPEEATVNRLQPERAQFGIRSIIDTIGQHGLDLLLIAEGLSQHVSRASLEDDAPLAHEPDPVPEAFRLVEIVSNHEDRATTITKVAQYLVNGASCLKVDPDCRFVEQQQLGFSDQCNSDVDPPLQTTRERCSDRIRDGTKERNVKEAIDRSRARVRVEKAGEDFKVLTNSEAREDGDALRHMTDQTKNPSVLAGILQGNPDTDAAARQWQLAA
jgi:hypothetical protein